MVRISEFILARITMWLLTMSKWSSVQITTIGGFIQNSGLHFMNQTQSIQNLVSQSFKLGGGAFGNFEKLTNKNLLFGFGNLCKIVVKIMIYLKK